MGGNRTRWTRAAGGRSGGTLTPYAAVLAEEKPNRLIALDPRTGKELLVLRTSANALAIGPAGMVIGEGREIGYVRFGAGGTAPARPSGDGGVPGPGGSGPGDPGGGTDGGPGDCGPKRELCPERDDKDG